MNLLAYTELLDDVLPHLAADPSDPVTENAIRRAVIEFCAGSWIWQQATDPTDILAGESEVDIEAPSAADVAAVLNVSVHGRALEKRSTYWLSENMPDWRTDAGVTRFYTQQNTDQILLAPLPPETVHGKLFMNLALQPSRDATGFPRWIADRYQHQIADGAIARLMQMPNKPWTDLQGGAARRADFEVAIAAARLDALTALQGAPIRSESQH